MKVSDFSIKHPAIITILLIAVFVFGLLSFIGLKQELFPPIQLPSVLIVTTYPGVGPEDIDTQITSVIEDSVSTLAGVSSITSVSEDSVSTVTVEFEYGEDIDLKLPSLRELLNASLSDLPEGLPQPPMIFKMVSNSMPVFSTSVESSTDREVLSDFVDERVVPFIARIPGVSQVRVSGKGSQVVEIRLRLSQLESKGIPVLDIYELLRYSNISFPAGTTIFRGNALQVRTLGEFNDLEEIENLVVAFKDNTYLTLKDVADVQVVQEKPETYTLDGEKEILLIDVFRQEGADSVKIIRRLRGVLQSIEEETGGTVSFRTLADEGQDVRLAISSVQSAAVFGALLAVLILFFFLHNTRTTLIIGISIPLSLLIAFALMYLKGQSLNLMTLGALTLAIGMIVDSSIVILENIHRHYQSGLSRKEAASRGAAEMAGAVIASTTTTVSVFLPLLFTRGITGIILKDASWTVIYALSASLLVSVVVVPYLSALLLKKESAGPPVKTSLAGLSEGMIRGLSEAYEKALSWSLNNRPFVFFIAVLLLVISVPAADFLDFEFIPSTDMNEILLEIETPPGYTLEKTREKTEILDNRIRSLVPELEAAVYYVGQKNSLGLSSAKNRCYARLRLVKHSERSRSVHRIVRLLQETLPAEIPDMNITVKNGGLDALMAIVTGGSGFMIELTGSNLAELILAGESVENLMKQDPNILKTERTVGYDRQEVITDLSLDYMGNLGITAYEAAVTGRIVFNGMEAGTFRGDGSNHTILLNSDVTGKEINDDILNALTLKTRGGQIVSFSSFADLKTEPAVSSIHRSNKSLSLIITGHLSGGNTRDTSRRIRNALEDLRLPPGITWSTTGSQTEMIQSFLSLLAALGISVFLVYMVMVIQFERFIQPLIVMAAVPFTFIGVVGSLLVYGTTLNIVSFMGIIALGGIVVNNAIVMIDYTNLLRREGKADLHEAVLKGAGSRLKPILMTTLTTVLGVIPMALGFGEGAEIYAPLGQAISGGLVSSTLITLFLIPTLYYTVEKRIEGRKR
ncbi:MAG: efflux RND transporter permease subunit [Spirochaetales bacterium]|nr:efflux RND transporter permease subunit [Spirochaetales bacterium]